jgi:hypothetical protein
VTTSSGDGADFFATSAPGAASGGRPGWAGTPSHLTQRESRWAKSDVTFGPVGRVVASVLLVLPLLFLVGTGLFTFDPFVLAGAIIYAVLMVTGLRHVWQPVKVDRR